MLDFYTPFIATLQPPQEHLLTDVLISKMLFFYIFFSFFIKLKQILNGITIGEKKVFDEPILFFIEIWKWKKTIKLFFFSKKLYWTFQSETTISTSHFRLWTVIASFSSFFRYGQSNVICKTCNKHALAHRLPCSRGFFLFNYH